ncbi:MAG TPA: hypothetical protein EYH14_01615 [Euryarchaeota archaeon]|nr:hypothetical protein [Euryarchaeota archaeon]
MKLDRDGIITILIGLALVALAWGVEYYFFAGGDAVQAAVNVVKDVIIGGIAGVGLLLLVVGILFLTAW